VAVVVDRARRHAEPDASAERLSAAAEHVVQRPASDAYVRRVVLDELRRRHRREMDALGREDVDVVEAEARVEVLVDDSERRHRADHVRLLDDSDAVDGPLDVALDQSAGEAAPAERDRGREPADAGSDDQYAPCAHGSPCSHGSKGSVRFDDAGRRCQSSAIALPTKFVYPRSCSVRHQSALYLVSNAGSFAECDDVLHDGSRQTPAAGTPAIRVILSRLTGGEA